MGKPHIWGILVLFLAACTSVPIAGTDLEVVVPAPEVSDSQPEGLPAEPQAAGSESEQLPAIQLEDYGPAPELTNEVWLNSAAPLRLADLHGQVVLLDMWTFG
jgi:hypothetical protein